MVYFMEKGYFYIRYCCAICFLPLFFVQEAYAIGSFKPTTDDLRLLPQYCAIRAASWGNDAKDPRVRRWFNVFGKDFIHMHHYCEGILRFRKSFLITDPRLRDIALKKSVDELTYTANKATKDFILWPELLTYRAMAFYELGETPKAMADVRRALEIKPDYVKAITVLADFMVKQGDFEGAKNELVRGRKIKPRSKSLKRRIDCLEGKRKDKLCPEGYVRN